MYKFEKMVLIIGIVVALLLILSVGLKINLLINEKNSGATVEGDLTDINYNRIAYNTTKNIIYLIAVFLMLIGIIVMTKPKCILLYIIAILLIAFLCAIPIKNYLRYDNDIKQENFVSYEGEFDFKRGHTRKSNSNYIKISDETINCFFSMAEKKYEGTIVYTENSKYVVYIDIKP